MTQQSTPSALGVKMHAYQEFTGLWGLAVLGFGPLLLSQLNARLGRYLCHDRDRQSDHQSPQIQSNLKARDIATQLGLKIAEVNSKLNGELRQLVQPDKSYRWAIRSPHLPQGVAGVEQRRSYSEDDLGKLCRYYLDCLSHDRDDEVSTFAASRYGDPAYVQIDSLPLEESGEWNPFQSLEAQKLVNKLNRDRSRLVLYLGYPVRVRHAKSLKTNWEGYFVDPVLLLPFEWDRSSTDGPRLSDEAPSINYEVLRRLTNIGSGQLIDESIQLTEALGLNAPPSEAPTLEEISFRLRDVRPEWDWAEDIDPYRLSDGPQISEIREQGIYNRAILISGVRSPFTKGLETELAKLGEIGAAQCSNTALREWLSGVRPVVQPVPDRPLLEVLPLNTEQRQAVVQGLERSLTVITGPPGTGKSQVVASLLINAAWHGQRVLFASKNHKAVDVVEERVNSFGPRPILLRLGSNEYQQRIAGYLAELLSASASPEDRSSYGAVTKRHEKIRERFGLLTDETNRILALRNRVDELEQAVEQARSDFGAAFIDIRSAQIGTLQKLLQAFSLCIDEATKSKRPWYERYVWWGFRSRRIRRAQSLRASIDPIANVCGVREIPPELGEQNLSQWSQLAILLGQRLTTGLGVQEYFQALTLLRESKSLEGISRLKAELTTELAESSGELWKSWLRLQPERLTPQERKLLGDFVSILRLISQAYEKSGTRAFRQYYTLLSQVANVLSCWAVTSLSAGGKLPFEAGFFDLLIIDEASQCDIASALPLLYRSKRAVIIGDPKQLRHISRLSPRQDTDLLAKYDLLENNAGWGYARNSLFDRATTLCTASDIIILRDHHRSHADIISFSNDHFYNGSLRVATKYDQLRLLRDHFPVRWVNVQGRAKRPPDGGALNELEAQAVVAELERLIDKCGYKGSIGVVTPFVAQANRIRDLVNQRDGLSNRLQTQDFLVHTAHKFQGDERDLILFSPVMSDGISDGAVHFLRSNGYLFNVAITRARASLACIGDMAAARSSGVDYLEAFSAYVANLRAKETTNREFEELGPVYPVVSNPEQVSDWERKFYSVLYEAGLRPIPQYPVGSYVLDFAIVDGERLLDIEVDGEMYHRNWDGELCRRDQIRNQRLFEMGWDVMRFWVYQIRDEQSACVERVRKWVQNKSSHAVSHAITFV